MKASPLAALPGANLLKRLINNYFQVILDLSEESKAYVICPEAWGKAHTLPDFKVFLPHVALPPLPPEARFLVTLTIDG